MDTEEKSTGAGSAAPGARRIRVLVVEDHPTNRRLTLLMLEKMNCAVEAAANGREGVNVWAHSRPELILMDCHMPVMDGYEATREIRRLEAESPTKGPRAHIVALTANAFPSNRETCLQVGMDGFITKPVQPETLRQVLDDYVAGGPPSSSSEASASEPEQSALREARAAIADLTRNFGPEAVAELLGSYLDDTPGRLEELRRLADGPDRRTFARAAHSLAGSSSIFGLQEIRKAGLELENRAMDPGGSPGPEVDRLEALFNGIRPELIRLRNAAAAQAKP